MTIYYGRVSTRAVGKRIKAGNDSTVSVVRKIAPMTRISFVCRICASALSTRTHGGSLGRSLQCKGTGRTGHLPDTPQCRVYTRHRKLRCMALTGMFHSRMVGNLGQYWVKIYPSDRGWHQSRRGARSKGERGGRGLLEWL